MSWVDVSELLTLILGTPYLTLPLIIAVWKYADLPKIKWNEIVAGALLVFAGDILVKFSVAMSPYNKNEWFQWLITLAGISSRLAIYLGYLIMGSFLIIRAWNSWKGSL